jgi:calcineurin-like phosphoesterase family protein
MDYFTSDTHFAHLRILEYCANSRPYNTIQEMNGDLVQKWNSRVTNSDRIIHLGDFSMGKAENVRFFLNQLNGYKILIKGNHDRSNSAMLTAGFNEVHQNLIIDQILNGKTFKVYLVHNPEHIPSNVYMDYAFCGHIHGLWKSKNNKIFNCGVDVQGPTPKTFEEIINNP